MDQGQINRLIAEMQRMDERMKRLEAFLLTMRAAELKIIRASERALGLETALLPPSNQRKYE